MVKVRVSLRALSVLACLVTVCTISCGDYSIRLPGGYFLDRVYSGAVVIDHPGDEGVVIEANVDNYAVVGPLVVGHASLAEGPESDYSKPGYFILDTQTHVAKEGLDKSIWLEALRAAGIAGEPKLHKPSRFNQDYLRGR